MTLMFCLLAVAPSATSLPLRASSQIADAPLARASETYRIVSRGFGPVGPVRVSRPTFSWTIVPQNGARVTGTTILLNGKAVPAAFDAERSEVVYTPAQSLPKGDYKVQIQVEISEAVTFKKEFSTTVPADAVDRLPAPCSKQIEVFRVLNAQRVALGLQAYTLDDSLSAAAESHATYLADNTTTGHVQEEGAKGFTGTNPWDRTRAYGFSGGTWETAGYEISDPKEAFAAIYDAPYHRIPFLQPGTARVGVGVSSRGTVIDGEIPYGKGTVVSPGDGEKGVPLSWKGYENPDPLRHWSELQRPTGYPIVLADFGGDAKLEVTSARLTLDGKEVRAFLATPAMDEHLTNAAILIPAAPLAPGKRYEVQIAASREGRDVSRRWSFTTAS